MRYEIHKHDVVLSPQLDGVLKQKVTKLEQRLKTYHPDAAHLELQFKHSVKDGAHVDCALTLHLIHDHLHAHKDAPELHQALDRAFDALFKELEHYRARVNKSLHPHSAKASAL
jgi:ribosomal subunit interface protein